jgi:hypothetical protein
LKKVVAILLLLAHLPNLTGYTVFFEYFIHQNNEETVQQLDKGNYNKEELIELKVPLNQLQTIPANPA